MSWRVYSGIGVRVLAIGALIASLFALPAVLPAQAAPGDPAVTGSFFVDFDRDGVLDAGEGLSNSDALFPPSGVTVTAFDSAGNSVVGTVTPGSPATYSVDSGALVGSSYRLEFSLDPADIAAGWSETFHGADSGSSVQFVSAGDVTHFGVVPPSQCPTTGSGFDGNANSAAGKLWTTCFVNGLRSSGGPADVFVGINADFGGSVEKPGAKNGGTTADNTVDGASDELGSLWGVAYDEWTSTLFTSSALRRHSDLGLSLIHI